MSRQEQIIERLTTLLDEQGCPPLVIQDVRWIVEDVFDIPDAVHYRPSILSYNGGWANLTICKNCGAIGVYRDCHPTNPCSNCGHKKYNGFREVSGRWVKEGGWLSKKGHWELDKSVPELS
jgi:hypothetical protein